MSSNNPNHKLNLVNFKTGKDPRRKGNGRPKKIPELDILLAGVMGAINPKTGLTIAEEILWKTR